MIAIRGAVRVPRNDRNSISGETRRLLRAIQERNGFGREQIVSAFFTMTPDLDAEFPARAARSLGWTGVPMLGAQETPVPGAPDRMIRVLLHVNAPGPPRHVYLGEAAAMRPDLAGAGRPARAPGAGPGTYGYGAVLVCGLGLIGGSVAMVLRRSGRFADVLGQDPDPRARELATGVGAVAAAGPDAAAFLERVDTVVLAMPVEEILRWLRRGGGGLRRGSVVLDVGSTKSEIVAAMEGLPEGVEAIGTHPMAGSERSGMEAARPDLFQGSVWALVETGRTGPRARSVAMALVEAAGARPLFIDAEAHDRATAVSLQLPYVVSGALALHAAGGDPAVRALAGPGLRGATRLAGGDPALMAGIMATNRRHLRRALREFRETLVRVVAALDAGLGSGNAALRRRGAERASCGAPRGSRATPRAGGEAVEPGLVRTLVEIRAAREALFPSGDGG